MSDSKMVYRTLGRCGTKVSAFGLGGWTTFGGSVTDQQTIRDIIKLAYDSGVNFFDIADVYARGQSEIEMGHVLKEFTRSTLVISSKVYFPMSDHVNDRGLSRKHIFESIDKSLKRIGTDYLDIYFCHRFDANTPLEETVRAMDDLVHQGKILYWGTSEWTGEQLQAVHKLCDKKNFYAPRVEQPEYNLLARERFEKDSGPVIREMGMGAVTWSPLASGVLTGKYSKGLPRGSRLERVDWLRSDLYKPENIERADQLVRVAKKLDCSPTQLALAWVAAQPGVSSVILGATRVEQLSENLGALSVSIDAERASEIDRIFS